jgi:hypothetical protein
MLLFNHIFDNLQNVQEYLILGDFNLPDISWSNYTASSQTAKEFLTICFRLCADQCVNFPTRGDNYLDLVLCSNNYRHVVGNAQQEPTFCTSDHISILCNLMYSLPTSQDYTTKPCFAKANYGLINAFLAALDWNVIYANCQNAEDYW